MSAESPTNAPQSAPQDDVVVELTDVHAGYLPGVNILNGAKLALDQHNSNNPNCQVDLKQFDTEGDPQKATQVAPNIVGDQTILGLYNSLRKSVNLLEVHSHTKEELASLSARFGPRKGREAYKNEFLMLKPEVQLAQVAAKKTKSVRI